MTDRGAPMARKVAIWAAGRLANASRSAATMLIAPLTALVADEDPDASASAVMKLRELGPGALAQAADELAAVADAEGPKNRADWALRSLVEIGDPRCVRLLARHQPSRPFAVGALLRSDATADQPPFSAALLEEVRVCLRGDLLGDKAAAGLVTLLGSWGPDAHEAIPDILQVLPRHEATVGLALAAISGATPEMVRILRQAVGNGTGLRAAITCTGT